MSVNGGVNVTKLTIDDCLNRTIASIEMQNNEKHIHYNAYSWMPEQGRCVLAEYTFFIAPLIQTLAYDGGIVGCENDLQEFITQYCSDLTEDQLVETYNEYDNGKSPIPIKISEIDLDTPCGCYLLIDDSDHAFISQNDNEKVQTNSEFEHKWILLNNSERTWKNRKLVFANSVRTNLNPDKICIDIPKTRPGESTVLRVKMKAGNIKQTETCQWRMVNQKGKICTYDRDIFNFDVTTI